MAREKSVGAVVFRRENSEVKFLSLHYKAGHWDFPKGHVEEGETEKETLQRELLEETGITEFKIIPEFREEIVYYFKRESETVLKKVTFYLVETRQEEVKISHEHQGYEWLDFEKAVERTTFGNAKELLGKADSMLKQL